MQDYIAFRVKECADYVEKTGATVRETAKVFGVSKSTVHKDLRERLARIDGVRYVVVSKIIERNKADRHFRGGRATKEKYLRMQNEELNSIAKSG